MKSVLLAVLGIALTVSIPQKADAGFFTGNDIYSDCQASRGDTTYYQKDMKCVAYIAGAFDGLDLARQINNGKNCAPGNITTGQLRDVVVKYMRDHPEKRNLNAPLVVLLSIMDAWGCGSE